MYEEKVLILRRKVAAIQYELAKHAQIYSVEKCAQMRELILRVYSSIFRCHGSARRVACLWR